MSMPTWLSSMSSNIELYVVSSSMQRRWFDCLPLSSVSRRPKEPELIVAEVKLVFGARTKAIPSPPPYGKESIAKMNVAEKEKTEPYIGEVTHLERRRIEGMALRVAVYTSAVGGGEAEDAVC